jgi:hypothetical protein
MENIAQNSRDVAGAHKIEILDTADNFYSGEIDSQEAAKTITISLLDAYNDGSAKDLFQELRTTPFGQANVKIFTNIGPQGRELQTIEITPGFWQFKEPERKNVGLNASILNAPGNQNPGQISVDVTSCRIPCYFSNFE